MAQCTAQSKQSNERCKRHASPGFDVCPIHGGKTPTGLASPHTKHGRYSRDLPTRLADRYQEAASDPDLLVMREDVALLDARLADVLSRVDSGESGRIWKRLKEAQEEYNLAVRARDADAMGLALDTITSLITRGHNDYAAWEEISRLLEQRRRLVESERRRAVEMQQMITADRAMLLMAAIVGVIKEHVHDPTQLRAIGTAINALVTVDGSR